MTTPRSTEPGSTPMGGASGAAPQASSSTGLPTRPEHGPTSVVPRAGGPRAAEPPRGPSGPGEGPGWAAGGRRPEQDPQVTTVLPGGATAPRPSRPAPARPAVRGEGRPAAPAGRPAPPRARRTRLSLRRVDPWSVFVFSLIAAVFLGVALIVAVAVLYAVLGSLGVTGSLNQLFAEVTGGAPTDTPLLTGGRIIGGAAVLAAVNVVLLTLLATLGALLYNLCASFTGGIELTLGERD